MKKQATNGQFKIEKGVPAPKRRYGAKAGEQYPFEKMEVGDSFEVQCENELDAKKRQLSILGHIGRHAPQGAKFTTRVTGNTVRCWRIA